MNQHPDRHPLRDHYATHEVIEHARTTNRISFENYSAAHELLDEINVDELETLETLLIEARETY